jgi:hypothetical protein
MQVGKETFLKISIKLRSKLSLRQKYLIKYFIAIFSTTHALSLLPFVKISTQRSSTINEIWSLLYPRKVMSGLRRVGGFSDGGYLIPDIDHIFDGLISPGVGDTFSFERDFVGNHSRAVLIDGTVPKPTNLPPNMIFLRKMLSGSNNPDRLSIKLQDIRSEYFATSKSLALQMDIEGAEYEVLASMKAEDLAGLDLILVEFHNLHRMVGLKADNPLIDSINLLTADFVLVHTHPNNAGGFFCHRFGVYPKVVETSWIRKNLVQIGKEKVSLPHPFDVPNDSLIWDLNYPQRFKNEKFCS